MEKNLKRIRVHVCVCVCVCVCIDIYNWITLLYI